jgi:hypothetical protein
MEKSFQRTLDATDSVVEGEKGGAAIQPMVDAAKNWWSQSAATPRFLMFAVGEITLGSEAGFGDKKTTDAEKEDGVPPLSEALMSDAEIEWLRAERAIRVQAGKYQNRTRLNKKYSKAAGEMGEAFGELMDFIVEEDREVHFIVVGAYGVSFRDPNRGPVVDGMTFSKVRASTIILHDSIHVPLLVYSNQRTRRTREVSDVVELVDLFPTVADWSGAEAPTGLPGSGLFADEADPYPWAYAELGDMFTLRKEDYLFSFRAYAHHITSLDPRMTEALVKATGEGQKYADPAGLSPGSAPVPGQKGRPKYSLFNIEDDPFQEHDISDEYEELTREYHQALIAIRQTTGAPAPDKMTDAAIRALRTTSASGYW